MKKKKELGFFDSVCFRAEFAEAASIEQVGSLFKLAPMEGFLNSGNIYFTSYGDCFNPLARLAHIHNLSIFFFLKCTELFHSFHESLRKKKKDKLSLKFQSLARKIQIHRLCGCESVNMKGPEKVHLLFHFWKVFMSLNNVNCQRKCQFQVSILF